MVKSAKGIGRILRQTPPPGDGGLGLQRGAEARSRLASPPTGDPGAPSGSDAWNGGADDLIMPPDAFLGRQPGLAAGSSAREPIRGYMDYGARPGVRGVIDRVEGPMAVVEFDDGMRDVPVTRLPLDAREGSVIVQGRPGESFVVDHEETEVRMERARQLMEELRGRMRPTRFAPPPPLRRT